MDTTAAAALDSDAYAIRFNLSSSISVNRHQARSLDYAVHSCFRKIFATTDQSVVEQCMIFFECHHVQDTMGERRRKFLHKFRMLQNQLCMVFNDRATADLE